MFRASCPPRTTNRKPLASSLALALALVTGTAVAGLGFAEPAHAQKKKESKPSYSKGFVEAYSPVEKAFSEVPEGGDYTPLKAQLPSIVSAVENEDDRMAAGQFVLTLGNKASDPALQRQGLELMLASGKVAPEQVGQFEFFVGNLAYQAKDYAAARTAMEKALAAGYTDDQAQALIIESYFQTQAVNEGLAYLNKVAGERQAAGQAIPEGWLLRGLQVSYQNKLAGPSNELAATLVESNPSAKNWLAALQVVREVNGFGDEEILDLSRLMQRSGAMQNASDLAEYVDAADPRKLANEVIAALDAAAAAGVIQSGAPQFAEAREIAQERAAADRADAAKAPGQSQATGTSALATADLLLSVGDFANAETMYQAAIDKGGVDTNRALTRKGIAQVRQGKAAEAQATFAKVQGVRAPLARMWAIYAEDQGSTAAGG